VLAEREFLSPLTTCEEVLNQSYGSKITTRRSLLKNAALSAAAAVAVPAFGNTGKHGANAGSSPSSFANLIDHPTFVTVFVEEKNTLQLDRTGDTWVKETCMVDITSAARGLSLGLVAPFESVLRVHVRWRVALPAAKLRVLSDAWERSYGDLGWREVIPECPLQ
jgi:alpha-galactosidase